MGQVEDAKECLFQGGQQLLGVVQIVGQHFDHVEPGGEEGALARHDQGVDLGIVLAVVNDRRDLSERLEVECIHLVAGQRHHGRAADT